MLLSATLKYGYFSGTDDLVQTTSDPIQPERKFAEATDFKGSPVAAFLTFLTTCPEAFFGSDLKAL